MEGELIEVPERAEDNFAVFRLIEIDAGAAEAGIIEKFVEEIKIDGGIEVEIEAF